MAELVDDVALLYQRAGDAAGRSALDQAWAAFRGFTMPTRATDDELGIEAIEREEIEMAQARQKMWADMDAGTFSLEDLS